MAFPRLKCSARPFRAASSILPKPSVVPLALSGDEGLGRRRYTYDIPHKEQRLVTTFRLGDLPGTEAKMLELYVAERSSAIVGRASLFKF